VIEAYVHEGTHPDNKATNPTNGKNGTANHSNNTSAPTTVWTHSHTIPTAIKIKRTNAPMNREINRSTNALNFTPIGPFTLPADIWRKGAKSVRANSPIEK
jgi:hypothetical protein